MENTVSVILVSSEKHRGYIKKYTYFRVRVREAFIVETTFYIFNIIFTKENPKFKIRSC